MTRFLTRPRLSCIHNLSIEGVARANSKRFRVQVRQSCPPRSEDAACELQLMLVRPKAGHTRRKDQVLMSQRITFRYLSESDMIAAGVTDMGTCIDTMEDVFRLAAQGDYRLA